MLCQRGHSQIRQSHDPDGLLDPTRNREEIRSSQANESWLCALLSRPTPGLQQPFPSSRSIWHPVLSQYNCPVIPESCCFFFFLNLSTSSRGWFKICLPISIYQCQIHRYFVIPFKICFSKHLNMTWMFSNSNEYKGGHLLNRTWGCCLGHCVFV